MADKLEKLEQLETLINDVLRDEASMTLAELINLIARPISYDSFCCRLR
ncbi:MAG: hypothetical protein L6Q60_00570 [Rhodocyclaceae bacterium]|nr:hypothetical protein [Rhodocyclaceae bacterium]